jgi:crotonobetainyl-CoA:carnitine CoA-transferase CaiB-like acyl-CoA transferase
MIDFLNDVRVLECSMLINGCSLGNFFGDAGADVIKIEPPPLGDYIRDAMGSVAPRQSPVHLQLNKNKRSLILDLRSHEGRDVFWDLLATADVFVDGFMVGACDRLGIGYVEQRRRKPDIVYVQYTGYGATEPYARIPTHGRMMSAAAARFRVAVSEDGLIRPAVHDDKDGPFDGIAEGGEASWVGAIQAAYYTVCALQGRSRTGAGCYIDVSAADAVITSAWAGALYAINEDRLTGWNAMPAADADSKALVTPSPAPALDGAKYFFYETKDHAMVLFACVERKWWESFCELVGRPDLTSHHNTEEAADMAIGDVDLYYTLREIMLTRTRDEWVAFAADNDLPIGPVNLRVADLVRDPQFRARSVFVDDHHPYAGDFTYIGPPLLVDGQPYEIRRPAPLAGEHSTEILAEIGYGADRIDHLTAHGIVRSADAERPTPTGRPA